MTLLTRLARLKNMNCDLRFGPIFQYSQRKIVVKVSVEEVQGIQTFSSAFFEPFNLVIFLSDRLFPMRAVASLCSSVHASSSNPPSHPQRLLAISFPLSWHFQYPKGKDWQRRSPGMGPAWENYLFLIFLLKNCENDPCVKARSCLRPFHHPADHQSWCPICQNQGQLME